MFKIVGMNGREERKRFERYFAGCCDTKHVLLMTNGAKGLSLIIRACGFGAGDEIIVPSNVGEDVVSAVSKNGCVPVPVEPDSDTFNINPDKIETAITPKTKAIVVVHMFGQAVLMTKIWEISMMYGLKVFEDGTWAAGASYQGIPVGNLAHAACFSFDFGQGTGRADVITTNDDALYGKLESIADVKDCQ